MHLTGCQHRRVHEASCGHKWVMFSCECCCSIESLPLWRRRRLYPHLAKLVCSGQPGVRTALGDLLRQQLPSVIAGAA